MENIPGDAGIPGLDLLLPGGIPRHCSILLLHEGGPLAEPLGYQFILAGVAEREGLIVAVSSKALDDFLRAMASLTSLDLNQFGEQVEIVDWHSWRRDRINSLEEQAHVLRCPRGLMNVDIAVARANRIIRDYAHRRAFLDFLGVAVQVATPDELVGKVDSIVSRLTKDNVLALYPADLRAVPGEIVDKIKDRFTAVIGLETRPDGYHLRLLFYEGLPHDGPETRLVQNPSGAIAVAPPGTAVAPDGTAPVAVGSPDRSRQGVKIQGAGPPAAAEGAAAEEGLLRPSEEPALRPIADASAVRAPPEMTPLRPRRAPQPLSEVKLTRDPEEERARRDVQDLVHGGWRKPEAEGPVSFYPFQAPGFPGWGRAFAAGAVLVVVMLLLTSFLGAGMVLTFSHPYRKSIDEEASYRLEGKLVIDVSGGAALVEIDLPRVKTLTEPNGELDQQLTGESQTPAAILGTRYEWPWGNWTINASGRVEITFWSDVVGSARTWTIAPGESGKIGNIPGILNNRYLATADGGNEWLGADGKWKINARETRAWATGLATGKETVLEIGRAVYEFLVDEIVLDPGARSGEPLDALTVYQQRRGRADEICFLGVSLLRALGIPAWMQFGAARDSSGVGWVDHAWIRFHVPIVGGGDAYVTMDPARRQWMHRAADQMAIWEDDGNGAHLADVYAFARKSGGPGQVDSVSLSWSASRYVAAGSMRIDDPGRGVGYDRLDFAPGAGPLLLLLAAFAGGGGLTAALWWFTRARRPSPKKAPSAKKKVEPRPEEEPDDRPRRSPEAKPLKPERPEKPVRRVEAKTKTKEEPVAEPTKTGKRPPAPPTKPIAAGAPPPPAKKGGVRRG